MGHHLKENEGIPVAEPTVALSATIADAPARTRRLRVYENEGRVILSRRQIILVRPAVKPRGYGNAVFDFTGENGLVNVDPGGTIWGPGPYLKVPARFTTDGWEAGIRERVFCPYGYPGQRLSMKAHSWQMRLNAVVTEVQCKRLHELGEVEMERGGLEDDPYLPTHYQVYGQDNGSSTRDERWAYETLWNHHYGPASWAANPWVWVVQFRVIDNQ